MPKITWTLAQHEDILGLPIILLEAVDQTTNTVQVFRLRDLPATGIAAILQWLNDRLSTP